MRGKAKQHKLVEEFVAWLVPDDLPPRQNAVRGFATDLFEVADGETITTAHLDALVRRYRRRFAGPRTIVDARNVGEQLCHWCEARESADEDDNWIALATQQRDAQQTASSRPAAPAAAAQPAAQRSRPPRLVSDTLPDSGPPPPKVSDSELSFQAELARLACAADDAQVGTLPSGGNDSAGATPNSPQPPPPPKRANTLVGVGDRVDSEPPPGLEIDFKNTGPKAAGGRANTIPGLGRALAAGKKIPSGEQRRITGPTLPGIGIGNLLGDQSDGGGRDGIFRGTQPGMGVPAEPDEDPAEADLGQSPQHSGPSTQPGIGAPRGNAPPPPSGPAPLAPPPQLQGAAPPSPLATAQSEATYSSPPASAPLPPAPGVHPAQTPSVPPRPSAPPRTSYRPIIPDPPKSWVASAASRIGLTGTPAERLRFKLVAMGIAALILLLLVFSWPGCLGAQPREPERTPAGPAQPSTE